jgi:hypothetical protein
MIEFAVHMAKASSRKPCDSCGVQGARLFLVRNLKELEGCLLAPKMERICDPCREQIFLELEALKRQAARMSAGLRMRSKTKKHAKII